MKDFVQPHREQPKKQVTRCFEKAPGQQAQMDWAEIGLYDVDGRLQKIYAFLMVLGYSRVKYIEVTTDMKLETLMKCHMNTFAYFNGMPYQVLYDKMGVFGDDILAAIILDRLLHHSVTFNIKGDSYRLKEKKKGGIYSTNPPAK